MRQSKRFKINETNQKLLEVQEPFLEKVPGRRRQKLTMDSVSDYQFKDKCFIILHQGFCEKGGHYVLPGM